jgi:hypothetical protein
MADGMYLSVVCSDYAQYESVDEAIALEKKIRPEIQSARARPRRLRMGARAWPKRAKAADVVAPVAAGVPTLAIGGATTIRLRRSRGENLAAGDTAAKSPESKHGALALHGSVRRSARWGSRVAFFLGAAERSRRRIVRGGSEDRVFVLSTPPPVPPQ